MVQVIGKSKDVPGPQTSVALPPRGRVISVNNSMITFAHPSASSSLITLVFALIAP
jgi:hypothetical protein